MDCPCRQTTSSSTYSSTFTTTDVIFSVDMRKMMVKRATSNSGLTPMKEPPTGFTKPFQLNCRFRTWSSSSGFKNSKCNSATCAAIYFSISAFTVTSCCISFLLCLCYLLLCSLYSPHGRAFPEGRTAPSCEDPWSPFHIWLLPQTHVQIHRNPHCNENKTNQHTQRYLSSVSQCCMTSFISRRLIYNVNIGRITGQMAAEPVTHF